MKTITIKAPEGTSAHAMSPAPRCQGCQGPPGEIEPCPFAEELYGDEKPCNCCDECRRGCAEEV